MASNVIPIRANDGLANFASGRGTSVDRSALNFWHMQQMVPTAIEAAYRTNWMIAKIVDLPPRDMCKEWRDWQADKADIAKLEKEEDRLQVKQKIRTALSYGRLGGGVLLIGLGDDPTQPLPSNIRPGQIQYLHPLTRWQVTIGDEDLDVLSPTFGEPLWYELTAATQRVRIHPSRMIPFRGEHVPNIGTASWQDRFWGDSIVQRINQAVQQATTATDGFAALIDEAKLDVWKLKGFMSELALDDTTVTKRVEYTNLAKSTHRAVILDSEDEFEQRQITWAGMPDVIKTYLSIVAGAGDFPATKLLGKSADGMNATGEGDEKNYREMLASKQDSDLRPNLKRLDRVLIPSAGVDPNKAVWTFAPLSRLTEKELADIAKTKAETVAIYVDKAILPSSAIEKAAQNMLIEDQWLPGLEDALKEAEAAGELPGGDVSELGIVPLGQEGGDQTVSAGSGGASGSGAPARRAANDAATWLADATPRPLYVQRKLLWADAKDLIAWAKENGFTSTLSADDMHVTVLYSRSPVDPMKMGRDWSEDEKGQIVVRPGGPRAIEKLGENAVVLRFVAPDLEWRHKHMIEAGGSHDWPEYQPHITISYEVPEGFNIDAIKPFNGALRFGPEEFSALDLDWKSKITEA